MGASRVGFTRGLLGWLGHAEESEALLWARRFTLCYVQLLSPDSATAHEWGAEQILNGKTKLGTNAAAAAGPSAAQASSYNAAAMNVDVLTYSRSKGLFAGVSLEGASMDSDNDANKSLYGKELSAKDIVEGGQSPSAAAKPLDEVLTKASPARK